MDGQVSGLGTVHPFSLLDSLAHEFFFFFMLCHVSNVEEEVVVIRNGWTPMKSEDEDEDEV